MNTVLVVEDEKAIRQGIAAIIRRCGVPVGQVVECRSGAEALAAVDRHGADVLFTDLRMPQMDGLELVRQLQKRPHPPLVVVISGYDDFALAVELMRMGARDYLLKPVDRDQITRLLRQFEAEFAQAAQARQGRQAAAIQVARALMLGDEAGEGEIEVLSEQYGSLLFADGYRVACLYPAFTPAKPVAPAIEIGPAGPHRAYLVLASQPPAGLFGGANAGYSAVHSGLGRLRAAYLQADATRQHACLAGRSLTFETLPATALAGAANAKETAEKLIQLLGRHQPKQAGAVLGEVLLHAQNGRLPPAGFSATITALLAGLAERYATFPDLPAQLAAFGNCWQADSAYQYYEGLCRWMEGFSARLHAGEENLNRQKINDALQYMRQNFNREINMAVVSNHVSMNYSQFSTLFKRYAGQNFQDALRGLRIERAKALLADETLGIREVAAAAGFKNEKHFMKAFKQATAVSPGDYRKNLRRAGGPPL